ncbi:MAG: hypothetical protein H7840_08850 [Alphaproteobacteria bacterium]
MKQVNEREERHNEARLVLSVSLPRIARQSSRVLSALSHPSGSFGRRYGSLVDIRGAEGLAVLAPLPLSRRLAAVRTLELPANAYKTLSHIVGKLGVPDDPDSPASALVQAFPEVARDSDYIDLQSAPVDAPDDGGDHSVDGVEQPSPVAHERPQGEGAPSRLARLLQLVRLVLPADDSLIEEVEGIDEARIESEPRDLAQLMFRIADVLRIRGQVDEALRTWREDVLPVHERLGDERERAVTMGRIADVLTMRGEVDEALRIRREEELPVHERLGDERDRAVTMGKIADILADRGEVDEALRIWRKEVLPVFERLGDERSRAVTMGKIADVLTMRGEVDEALRIRREEELPVYERLGDARSRAVTMGKIADILTMRGEVDEALRIRREEQLPVFERLGEERERAVTMGKIAGILADRGEVDEALRLHIEERLPVARAMGDIDSIAHIRSSCARIRIERGGLETDEAPTILEELTESFTLARQLGRVVAISAIGSLYGQVLAVSGQITEALAVLDQAAEAYATLKRPDDVAKIRDIQATISQSSRSSSA